jgi:pullulanase/glycogen debranching enzyme
MEDADAHYLARQALSTRRGLGWPGLNFALFSEYAISVEVCLFASPNDPYESERIRLPMQTDMVWPEHVLHLLTLGRALIRSAKPSRRFTSARSSSVVALTAPRYATSSGFARTGRMTDDEWRHAFARCLGMLLNGQAMDKWGECGEHVRDDILLVLLNAYWEPILFTLPSTRNDLPWEVFIDTTATCIRARAIVARRNLCLGSGSLALLVYRINAAASDVRNAYLMLSCRTGTFGGAKRAGIFRATSARLRRFASIQDPR